MILKLYDSIILCVGKNNQTKNQVIETFLV